MTKEKRKNNPQADLLHQKQKIAEKKRKRRMATIISKNRNRKTPDVILPLYIKYEDIKELTKNLVNEYKNILDKKKWLNNNTISSDEFLKRKNNPNE